MIHIYDKLETKGAMRTAMVGKTVTRVEFTNTPGDTEVRSVCLVFSDRSRVRIDATTWQALQVSAT